MASVLIDCRRAMASATDYQTWFEAAQELDRWEGMETWREEEASGAYDFNLIRDRLRQLRKFRQTNDIPKLVYYLRQGMHWNLGNICNPALYIHSRVGTKYLIHDYLSELASTLDYLCDTDFPDFPVAEKVRFFQDVALSFGRTGLMLSGGATMGFFHAGVIKALWKKNMLPRVISGSSAGALVAAAIGTVRDEEVGDFLNAEEMDRNFWRWLHPRHAVRRRVIADENRLREALSKLLRDMTFSEAYEHSQRIINITVSPANANQMPRLLNYLTFPHLYLLEAVQASCAIPFVFPPVMLMTRHPEGKRVPFMPTLKWTDGSMKSDLPILRLRRLHNVNHTIVSQTNPLVLPFMQFKGEEHFSVGESTRDFVMSTATTQLKHAVDLGRRVLPTNIVRRGLASVHALLEQDYRGNITILPRFKLINYLRLAANPTAREIDDYILEGERSTWPRLALIRNSTMISQTLDGCLERLNAKGAMVEAQIQPRKRPPLRLVR